MDEIKKKIYGFKTKHKEGFIQREIEALLKDYPEINIKQFNNAFMGNTCIVIDDEIINYHCDVEMAIRCGVENRNPKTWEWD